jgi:hypothetical protein
MKGKTRNNASKPNIGLKCKNIAYQGNLLYKNNVDPPIKKAIPDLKYNPLA